MRQPSQGLRLHIGLFGRMNVGKSSFMNLLLGQQISIVSPVAGTTTDVVEKTAELLPLGPITFLDTAGLDDESTLGSLRREKTTKAIEQSNIAILVTTPGEWSSFEEDFLATLQSKQIPTLIVVNKIDLSHPDPHWLTSLRSKGPVLLCKSDPGSSKNEETREPTLNEFKAKVAQLLKQTQPETLPLVADLLPAGGLTILVVPIDLQAPKGRLILPQVQVLREALDCDASALVVKERELAHFLKTLGQKPNLVICDSQAILKVAADTPPQIPCTTFSILMARAKGDLAVFAEGAAAIHHLKPGDPVLIAEGCTHHSLADDIGKVKIPRWLRQRVKGELLFEWCNGRDFPSDLSRFKLIIHCGSCTLTRKEVLNRISIAKAANVPITNYGLAISTSQGVIERVLEPFPYALHQYRRTYGLYSNPETCRSNHLQSRKQEDAGPN